MTKQEKDLAVTAATKFLETNLPSLNSGNMIPVGTITFVSRPLRNLARIGDCEYGYWPDPAVTASDRDPASFDSAIVIFQNKGYDRHTGQQVHLGCYSGLAWHMGTGQTYATFPFSSVSRDQRNAFIHEWGHSIT